MDSGNSMPPGLKKLPQCLPTIAVTITQAIKNAPTRVKNPKSIRTPPTNSERAAAPSHSHAGRMKLNGTEPEIHTLNPLPAKLPNTFWEPCAIKTVASASRRGTVTQLDEVLMIRLSIYSPFELRSFHKIAEILVYLSQKV